MHICKPPCKKGNAKLAWRRVLPPQHAQGKASTLEGTNLPQFRSDENCSLLTDHTLRLTLTLTLACALCLFLHHLVLVLVLFLLRSYARALGQLLDSRHEQVLGPLDVHLLAL